MNTKDIVIDGIVCNDTVLRVFFKEFRAKK